MIRESAAPIRANPARAYGRYAARYDDLLHENRINAYLRRETTRNLFETFRPGERLIELGCGTGDEALALAARSNEIVGVDPAEEMISISREKARGRGLESRVRFVVGGAADLRAILPPDPGRPFHGAYSHFALSYEPDLHAVRDGLAALLAPGSDFVVAALNRFCLTEWIAAMAVGRPGLAGRRLARRTTHKVGDRITTIFPRTVSELESMFAPAFVLEDVRALPGVLPPHYANRALRRFPALVDLGSRADPAVSRTFPLRFLGDHTLLRFRRGH